MRLMMTALVLLLLLGLFPCAQSLASVPPVINYQGKLMQPSGCPVPDGTYSMTFAIYPTETGGSALWSETNPGVQTKGGLFAVLLGSVINLPANIFDSPDRWFGVTVGADAELTPRQKIASSAFAFGAAIADTVPDGAITGAKIAIGAVTADRLAPGLGIPPGTISMFGGSSAPDGWLLCNGQAVSRSTYAALFAAIGTAYGAGDGGTTFNLPNVSDKFPIGVSATKALASAGGSESHTHTGPNHYHTGPSHQHTLPFGVRLESGVLRIGWDGTLNTGGNMVGTFRETDSATIGAKTWQYIKTNSSGTGSTGYSGTAATGPTSTLPSYVALNYIIKY